jgi:Protein of unknown function (DUF732)
LIDDNGADLYKDEAMRLLVVLAGFGAVIGLAAPAQADPDGDFLGALNNAGITYKKGPDAIGIGQRACQAMDQGHSEADVIKSMVQQNPGFTNDAATRFVQIAENVYCPQHIGGTVAPPPPSEPVIPPLFPWPTPGAA